MFYSIVPDNLTVPASSPAHTYKYLYLAAVSPFQDEAKECFLQGKLQRNYIHGYLIGWSVEILIFKALTFVKLCIKIQITVLELNIQCTCQVAGK